jgi:hypothetical protein
MLAMICLACCLFDGKLPLDVLDDLLVDEPLDFRCQVKRDLAAAGLIAPARLGYMLES